MKDRIKRSKSTLFHNFRLVGLALLLSVGVGSVGQAEGQFQFGTEVTMDEKIEQILNAARSNCSSKAGQFEFKDQTTQIPIHAPITSIEIDILSHSNAILSYIHTLRNRACVLYRQNSCASPLPCPRDRCSSETS